MTTFNPDTYSALEQLAITTRQLINNVVQLNAADTDVNTLIADLEAINSRMQNLPRGRSIPHYDLSLAKTLTNYTLPYSPVCGPYNPIAPPVDMHYDAVLQQVIGKVRCELAYEGPKHMVHGAVIAGIYDQLLALVSSCSEQPSFTAYLHIDYKKPTPLFEELVFRAWVENKNGRKLVIKGQCTHNNEIVTEAEGLFIQLQG